MAQIILQMSLNHEMLATLGLFGHCVPHGFTWSMRTYEAVNGIF